MTEDVSEYRETSDDPSRCRSAVAGTCEKCVEDRSDGVMSTSSVSWVHVNDECNVGVEQNLADDEDESAAGSSDSVSIVGDSDVDDAQVDGRRLAREQLPSEDRSSAEQDARLRVVLNIVLLVAIVLDLGMCIAYAAGWSEQSNVVVAVQSSFWDSSSSNATDQKEQNESQEKIESLISQNARLSERISHLESEISRLRFSFEETVSRLEKKLDEFQSLRNEESFLSKSWGSLKEKLPDVDVSWRKPDVSGISSSVSRLLDGVRSKVLGGDDGNDGASSKTEAVKKFVSDGADTVKDFAVNFKDKVVSRCPDFKDASAVVMDGVSQSGRIMANLVGQMKMALPSAWSESWWSTKEGQTAGDGDPTKVASKPKEGAPSESVISS